jgi:hypothetical protein
VGAAFFISNLQQFFSSRVARQKKGPAISLSHHKQTKEKKKEG